MATFSPQVQYTCTTFYYVRPLPPLERALHLCLYYGGPAGPEALAAATSTPLADVYRAIVELLRHGLITLADATHSIARPARRQERRPRLPDAPIADRGAVYVATTTRHTRPLTQLEQSC